MLRVSDLLVIGVYFAAMVGLGFVFMRRNRTSDAYFRAGGRLPWWVEIGRAHV